MTHASPADPAIRLVGVQKRFPGSEAPAVGDLSLDIPLGSLVVLVGPSGCGKTTTLKMINRLVEPTAGEIYVDGTEVRSLPAAELRRRIGYVIQQIGLFPHRTIAQNIATVPRLLGWDRRRVGERVDELVDLVGLEEAMLRRYPTELSGGQQQRVGVARALAADPPVLLMDEPYSAVDPIVRARLQDELVALQRRVRKTIVLVTHDVDEAIKVGDRIALLNVGGVLEQYDEPDEVLRAPATPFVEEFLGAERSLRRLTLATVASLELGHGSVLPAGTPASDAIPVLDREWVDWVGVVDGDRFLGWVHRDALTVDAKLGDLHPESPAAVVSPDSTLRAALEVIMNSRTSVGVVLDEGRFLGVVTLEGIRQGLR